MKNSTSVAALSVGDPYTNAAAAFDRLLDIALTETGGGTRRVADFILAWWNGPDLGHFAVIDIAYLDRKVADDMIAILQFLSRCGVVYADFFGRRDQVMGVIKMWRGD